MGVVGVVLPGGGTEPIGGKDGGGVLTTGGGVFTAGGAPTTGGGVLTAGGGVTVAGGGVFTAGAGVVPGRELDLWANVGAANAANRAADMVKLFIII